MLKKTVRVIPLSAVTLLVALAGCASEPEPAQPGPLNEPVDAFEAVGAPQRPGAAPQSESDQLSSDIERLQNARKTYEQEQRRLTTEMKRRQAQCRQQADSRKVAIEDGSGDPSATYCESAKGDESPDADKRQ